MFNNVILVRSYYILALFADIYFYYRVKIFRCIPVFIIYCLQTSTPEEILSQYWVTGIPSYTLLECRNMIRVLVQACKHAVHALKDTHATNR